MKSQCDGCLYVAPCKGCKVWIHRMPDSQKCDYRLDNEGLKFFKVGHKEIPFFLKRYKRMVSLNNVPEWYISRFNNLVNSLRAEIQF